MERLGGTQQDYQPYYDHHRSPRMKVELRISVGRERVEGSTFEFGRFNPQKVP